MHKTIRSSIPFRDGIFLYYYFGTFYAVISKNFSTTFGFLKYKSWNIFIFSIAFKTLPKFVFENLDIFIFSIVFKS